MAKSWHLLKEWNTNYIYSFVFYIPSTNREDLEAILPGNIYKNGSSFWSQSQCGCFKYSIGGSDTYKPAMWNIAVPEILSGGDIFAYLIYLYTLNAMLFFVSMHIVLGVKYLWKIINK